MRTLSLTEYGTEPDVPLTLEERDALARMDPAPLSITPTPGKEDHYDLTAGSWVGTINLGSLAIAIRPKIPIDRLLFLISYALDPRRWRDIVTGYVQEPSLVEAIIPGFVLQVRRALYRGVLQGYRQEEDALSTVRGRLRVAEQVRVRYGLFPPVEVAYDDFTEDIEENRLLKAAVSRLGRMPIRSEAARKSLREFDALLQQVALVRYNPRFVPEIAYNRLNAQYEPAVELARLVLRATGFELQHGGVQTSTFLVDMNKVFEDFLVVALREALGLDAQTFRQGAAGKSLYLDTGRAIKLEPDLSWWDGGRCRFVGDAKYKRVNVAGILNADIYQMLAYTVATGLDAGLLVYAAGEGDPATHAVVNLAKTLHVVALDLSGSADQILAQIGGLARLVRQLGAFGSPRMVS